jgi:hypothetical protein
MALLIFLILAGICMAFARYAASYLARLDLGNHTIRTWSAGILPTLLIIGALTIWHFIELGRQAPPRMYMSPLLILLYGYPFVLANLAINMAVAYRFGKSRS